MNDHPAPCAVCGAYPANYDRRLKVMAPCDSCQTRGWVLHKRWLPGLRAFLALFGEMR